MIKYILLSLNMHQIQTKQITQLSPTSKLYLGNIATVNSLEIQQFEISVVIGLISMQAYHTYNLYHKILSQKVREANIFHIHLSKINTEMIDAIIDFIETKNEEKNILVYCQNGKDISPIVAATLLIKYKSICAQTAMKQITRRHSIIVFSEESVQFLENFERKMNSEELDRDIPHYTSEYTNPNGISSNCNHILLLKNQKDSFVKYNLFLGSSLAVRPNPLKENNITAIVSILSQEAYKLLKIKDICGYFGLKHLYICMKDDQNEQISPYFEEAFKFIDTEILHGNVLVHCKAGKSRSASIVIGYLIWKFRVGYENAYNFVLERRPCICPNIGFQSELKDFAYQQQKMESIE